MKTVTVIGGGIAGLLSAIQFARAGIPCTLIEKKSYPFHRVCGEYISNETVPFLKSLDLFPQHLNPSNIQRLLLSSVSGKNRMIPLDLGGFGVSRFHFDHFLYQQAVREGVLVLENTSVDDIHFEDNVFSIRAGSRVVSADVVLASHGKRSNLDVRMNREFVSHRSPYVGVKYHVRCDFPQDVIALHNFPGGYCGVSMIEEEKVNVCYLVHRDKLRAYGSVQRLEQAELHKNPHLRKLFESSQVLFEKPETVSEISFSTKGPLHGHVMMVGDAAGMITPLCGNGMAMAIRSSAIASRLVINFCRNPLYRREQLEQDYATAWTSHFRNRLWFGRQVQRLFGSERASSLAVAITMYLPAVADALIRNTHGKPFI